MDPAVRKGMPPQLFVIASALYNLVLYGGLITLFHFVARSGLDSQIWPVQLLGVVPVTVFLWHWLVPNEGLVQFLGVPMLGQLRWFDRRMMMSMVQVFASIVIARAILLLALFTETFAAWTAFWYERGLINADRTLGGGIFAVAERFYLWNLADAVPSLNVPETLQWRLGPTFTDWRSGALLLVYKVVVIIPLIYGFVAVLRRLWDALSRSRQETDADDTQDSSPA